MGITILYRGHIGGISPILPAEQEQIERDLREHREREA